VRLDGNSVLIHRRSRPGTSQCRATVGGRRHIRVRHKLPLLCVISLNGGRTADPEHNKPGRDLGYTRYDIMAQGLGCYGEYVEQPEDIRPALERARKKVDEGMVALVNVKTDYRARATTVQFSSRMT
jgi:thiamine pyrophosphate-dependent acetolactate synthase large subunit-like protein